MKGQPRTDYRRTYVLMPPDADREMVAAAIDATWNNRRWTVGGSADDAGIGDLTHRRVIAVNPDRWGNLPAFFQEHYPGIEYIPAHAETAGQLSILLRTLAGPQPPDIHPQIPPFPLRGVHDLAGAKWLQREGLEGWCTIPVYIGADPKGLDLRPFADAGIRILVNLRYSYAVDDGGQGTMPAPDKLKNFETACIQTMNNYPGAWGFVYCNEMNNPREWPAAHELTPLDYLLSYNRVWEAKPPGSRLIPGAIDPYNAGWGDWRSIWYNVLNAITGADALALHAYTHGPNPALVWADDIFDHEPLAGLHYNLRILEDQQEIIPAHLAHLPQIVTETNHWIRHDGEPGWEEDAGEWVTEAYRYFAERGVAGACLFRFNYDDWRYGDKPAILDALKAVR